MTQGRNTRVLPDSDTRMLDALVIGAGFAGMYALHSLRSSGLSVRVYDAADGIGGTWWWNRYPGARVDFPGGPFYCYTFSEELVREWDWAETQPDQASVLAYLDHVADKFDLRRDIQLETRIAEAHYDETAQRWEVATSDGERVCAQFLICAMGTLSAANMPDIKGLKSFAGECYHTGQWPRDKVTFAGKRVGVIGTGSSGIQAIPLIAEEAGHLTVFQRTPQYTIPAGNRTLEPESLREARLNWPEIRAQMMQSPFGAPYPAPELQSKDHSAAQRGEMYERHWRKGSLGILFETYQDILTNPDTNLELAEFVREKIRETVRDPAVVEKLLPDYHLGTKRQVLDDGYYATFNRNNVDLVDLRQKPIDEIIPTGIRTADGEEFPLDMLVLATGFDAITGALQRLNPNGRQGRSLNEQWSERFDTYLGMTIPGFPNLFMIHGPESPSVLFNMPLGAELQSDWIRDCIHQMKTEGLGAIEATSAAATTWGREVNEIAAHTLYAGSESWYNGANIPGKHQQFTVYLGGPVYYRKLSEVAAKGYEGLVMEIQSG